MINKITAAPGNATQRKSNRRCFGQWKAKLVDALEEQLPDPDLADRFGAPPVPVKVPMPGADRMRNYVVFGLRLDSREIFIQPG